MRETLQPAEWAAEPPAPEPATLGQALERERAVPVWPSAQPEPEAECPLEDPSDPAEDEAGPPPPYPP